MLVFHLTYTMMHGSTKLKFDIAVFDYIPFPIFTHTTGMTHFQRQFVLKRRFTVTGLRSKHNMIYADNSAPLIITKIFAVSRNGIVNLQVSTALLDQDSTTLHRRFIKH